MSVPGPPLIKKQPLSLANTIKYAWNPPSQPNGTISAYKLVLSDDNSTVYTNSSIGPTIRTFIVGPPEITLTNGVTYYATLQAINENGEGEAASFFDWQPGNKPFLPPSTVTATVYGSNSALVTWAPPAQSVDSTIFWYTIISRSTNPSDPILKYTADGVNTRNYYITGLNNESRYYFDINAISCPGWSPKASTDIISFIPVGDYIFESSFPVLSNSTGFSNYDSNRLMVNTPTGSGYSYLTTNNYTASNSLYKSVSPITTSNISFTCSIYRTASAPLAGLLYQNTNGTGLRFISNGTTLGYSWNNDSGASNYTTGIVIPTSNWYQISLTITPSNAKWYVNGLLAVTRTASHAAVTLSNIFVGVDNTAVSTRSFPGYIDNIRFYDRTLTDTEVFTIYRYYQAIQTNTAIPTTVTGLQAWYDGSDPLGTGTAPSSGSVVTTWSDKSGNTRNATGTGSPTYVSNNFGYVNFNGSTQYYQLSTSAFINNQYFTIFVVERLEGNGLNGYPVLLGGSSSTNNANLRAWYVGGDSSQLQLDYQGNILSTSGSYLSAFTIGGAQPVRIWSFRQIASQRSIWLNGTPVSQDTNNTLLSSWANAQIGRLALGGGLFFGRMCDVIFYTGTITTANMQNIMAYLAQKWYVSLPPFIPLKVTGLALWLDASDASSFRLSGINVTQWRDKSGSGNHFSVVQGTPTRTTDGSLNVVSFGSSGITMQGALSVAFTTNFSVFAVCKLTAISGVFSYFFSPINGDLSIRYQSQTTNSLVNVQLQGGPSAGGNAQDFCSVLQVNGSRTATPSSVYSAYHLLDGSVTTASTGTPFLSPSTPGRFFIGNICEILVFNTPMNNLNREKIQGYLAWKWGINSLLPSTHTYYSVAPSV
jgi:hypothetical protein